MIIWKYKMSSIRVWVGLGRGSGVCVVGILLISHETNLATLCVCVCDVLSPSSRIILGCALCEFSPLVMTSTHALALGHTHTHTLIHAGRALSFAQSLCCLRLCAWAETSRAEPNHATCSLCRGSNALVVVVFAALCLRVCVSLLLMFQPVLSI